MPFETFVHACTLTLPPPFSPPPRPLPPPPRPGKKCQIRIPCQFIEKYPLPPKKKWILCQKNSLTTPPTSTRPDHTHLPPTRPFFSDLAILIICQLDSVLVIFFYKSKSKKIIFFRGGCRGGGRGGSDHNVHKCFKWHFYSSRNTNVPDYLKYVLKYKRNGPDKLDL